MAKKHKIRDPYRLTVGKQLAWSGRGMSTASNVLVLTYVTYYCTDMLGMNAVLVGTLLLASKVFDGFTDLVAGVLIDRTKTRLGKARPYEFSIIGVWICTILLYSCPELGDIGKSIWIFTTFTFINSIFATLLYVSEPVYLNRAFKYEDDRSKVVAINGFLITLMCTVVSVIFPILMGTLGTSRGGWTTISLITGIPLCLLGLTRLIGVKEVNTEGDTNAYSPKFKDFLPVLKNKYLRILCVVSILTNIIVNSNSTVGSYYFKYIVGDIRKMSVVGILGLLTPFLLLLMPKLLQKISIRTLFTWSFVIGCIGCIIRYFAGADMSMVVLSTLLQTVAVLPPSYFTLLLLIDIMDYQEWTTGSRTEGMISAVGSFSNKLGSGLSSGGVGLIMGLAGFDGTAAEITAPARASIVALSSWIPLILFIVMILGLRLFDLESKLPQIRDELAERRASKTDASS
ncbi:MFS transporter [Schaalia sp. ZJ1691]|uniref:MFS transporter n=1 Tax=Schaalia sp. ZJ1691 TaxID=2709404 RepID=UPI0013ED4A5E|nr:MFS transporter [Schaalia sp. ZJ1691]